MKINQDIPGGGGGVQNKKIGYVLEIHITLFGVNRKHGLLPVCSKLCLAVAFMLVIMPPSPSPQKNSLSPSPAKQIQHS